MIVLTLKYTGTFFAVALILSLMLLFALTSLAIDSIPNKEKQS